MNALKAFEYLSQLFPGTRSVVVRVSIYAKGSFFDVRESGRMVDLVEIPVDAEPEDVQHAFFRLLFSSDLPEDKSTDVDKAKEGPGLFDDIEGGEA